MNDTIDEKITLEAIKASVEVIENNTVEVKQLKESLQNIERLLESLLETANEAVGMLEEHQPVEHNKPAPVQSRSVENHPLAAIFAIGIFVVLSLLIWKWQPDRASRGIPATGTQISATIVHSNSMPSGQK